MIARNVKEFVEIRNIKAFLELLNSQEKLFVQGNWDITSNYRIERINGSDSSINDTYAIHILPPEDKGRAPDHDGISFYFTTYGSICGILTFNEGKPAIGSIEVSDAE